MDFEASKPSQFGHFLLYCCLKGIIGYFSTVDLKMGVHVRLLQVSTYRRLKMWSFREIAGTTVWCALMGGVC